MSEPSSKEKIYKEEMEFAMEVIFKLVGYLKVCTGSSSENCVLWCLENWGHGTSWATRGYKSVHRHHHTVIPAATES